MSITKHNLININNLFDDVNYDYETYNKKNIELIKSVMKDCINKTNKLSLSSLFRSNKRLSHIQNLIIEYTSFLPTDATLSQRCYHIYNNIDNIIKCKNCENIVKFISFYKGYKSCCSLHCSCSYYYYKKSNTYKNKLSIYERREYTQNEKDKFKKQLLLIKRGTELFNDKNKELRTFVLNQTNFLTQDTPFAERIFLVINNMNYIPSCKICGNPVSFTTIKKGYHDFCSLTCRNKIIGDLIVKSNIKKYGVTSTAKLNWVKQKAIETNLEKYNNKYYMQTNEFKEKTQKTNLEKYGCENVFQNDEIKEKIKQTNLERYGVENPMQHPDILDKSLNNRTDYQLKDYTLPSGKIIKVQGYEPHALDILLNEMNYDENDIITDITKVPTIKYKSIDNKIHVYYPDIYIPKENRLIEIKSSYTYDIELEINKLKHISCIKNNYFHEFWIIDRNGTIERVI